MRAMRRAAVFRSCGWGRGACEKCAADPPAFTQARAALRYDEIAQRLILPFKYADRTEAARGIAQLMLRPGEKLLAAADVLVPVPLHKSHLRARRYNQAALLARMAARLCIPNALIRQHATAPLARMDLAARQAEMQDAILVRPGFVERSKHVLLIDDVMTSGTTANTCALALLEAGASPVSTCSPPHAWQTRDLSKATCISRHLG
jgi:predicted amidophosphoribosyltransferase